MKNVYGVKIEERKSSNLFFKHFLQHKHVQLLLDMGG